MFARLNWPTWFGYLLFTGMMATGYYYNLTFVQFGLIDLGTRLVGMSRTSVALHMALLALLTCLVAIGFGFWMKQRGWNLLMKRKLQLAFVSVLVQTALTAVAPLIRSQPAFMSWIVVASFALGLGVPATFSLTIDLIPRRGRGLAAAVVTGVAFFAAEVVSANWQIEQFSAQILWLMVFGSLGLGGLAFGRFSWIDRLAEQYRQPAFWRGRFVQPVDSGKVYVSRRLLGMIVLMFAIFFIDSLGFLRLADTPLFFHATWQSPDLNVRLFIGTVHVAAALVAGLLYTTLSERSLFLWIFGLFALTHFMYVLGLRLAPLASSTLSNAMLYAIAVSLYTVINFALWTDISTPRTITINTALGVSLSGWTATFVSTALALRWQAQGVPLQEHLNRVEALALLGFVLVLIVAVLPGHQSYR